MLFGMATACGDTGAAPTADAAVVSPQPPPTRAEIEAARQLCAGELPVMLVRDALTDEVQQPDWSCYGKPVRHASAASARTLPFRLSFPAVAPMAPAAIESALNMLVSGVTVDFFFGPSTLVAPAHTHVFDTYSTQLEVPAGATSLTVAIHAEPRSTPGLSISEQRQYGIPIAADETQLEANFTLRDSHALAVDLALRGETDDPTQATIVALVRDCSGHNVIGAQFELIDKETGRTVPSSKLRSSYVQFALPNPDCTYSTGDWPAWFSFNAPVNIVEGVKQHQYNLRVQGRMHADDAEPRVIAERELELFAGGITFVQGY